MSVLSSKSKDWDYASSAPAASSGLRVMSAEPEEAGVIRLAGSTQDVEQSDESFKFVLRWGAQPRDLDSHLDGYSPDGQSLHVYFSKSSASYGGATYCSLDHDDIDSYGPETVDLASSSDYPCYYYIHNFSGSPDINLSGATVDIYKGGRLYATRKISSATGKGCYWNVCVVVDGEIKEFRDTITAEPELSYAGRKWTSTSTGKRTYPDYGHKYGTGKLDHFRVYTPGVADKYPDFGYFLEKRFPIPGLEYSSVGKGCDAQVPQGICVTNEYIIITEYCAGKDEKGPGVHTLAVTAPCENDKRFGEEELSIHGRGGTAEKHDSALYVLDRNTGAYLSTITLKGLKNHVGGIAFDDTAERECVWIATSTSKSNGKLQECMIPYSAIKREVAKHDKGEISIPDADDGSLVSSDGVRMVPLCDYGEDINSASFNTYHNGLLWVGNNEGTTHLVGFRYDSGNKKLVKEKSYSIPAKANGATFLRGGNDEEYLMVNVSPSRKDASSAHVYSVRGVSLVERKRFNLPPMLEEACVHGGKLYTIYESGATLYSCFDGGRGRAKEMVDEICVTSVESVLSASLLNMYFENLKAWSKESKSRISVACPVDVELYDQDGGCVGRISGGEVDDSSLSDGVTAWVNGDEKSFLVPNDMSYTIRAAAYDVGSMSISVVQYDDNGMPTSSVVRENVPLVQGSAHVGSLSSVSEDRKLARQRFGLKDSMGQVVPQTAHQDDALAFPKANVSVEAVGNGTVGRGSNDELAIGDYATYEAIPYEGSIFTGWYAGNECVCSDALYTFKAPDESYAITAVFEDVDYAISHVSVEGNGWVYTDDDRLQALLGEALNLKAIEADDSLFEGWYIGSQLVGTDSTYWFDSSEAEAITAKFVYARPAAITANADGNGVVEILENGAKVGGHAEVLASNRNGGEFVGWYAAGRLVSREMLYSFQIQGDMALVAKFKDVPKSLGHISVAGIGSGTVSIENTTVPLDDYANVHAVPGNTDAQFKGWYCEGDYKGSDLDCAIEVVGDMDLLAWFGDGQMTLDANLSGTLKEGTASVYKSSSQMTPDSRAYVGVDVDNADFLGWYENGKLVSQERHYSFWPSSSRVLEAKVRDSSAGESSSSSDSSGSGVGGSSVVGAMAVNRVSLASATISGIASKVYDGTAQTQSALVVKVGGKALAAGTDYTASYANNVRAGTATVTVSGRGAYSGSKSATFAIAKAAGKLEVSTRARELAASSLSGGAKSVFPIVVKKAYGTVTYKKLGGSARLSVNKGGYVAVKKGTPAGTYRIRVKVAASGGVNYKAASKTVVATVKVTGTTATSAKASTSKSAKASTSKSAAKNLQKLGVKFDLKKGKPAKFYVANSTLDSLKKYRQGKSYKLGIAKQPFTAKVTRYKVKNAKKKGYKQATLTVEFASSWKPSQKTAKGVLDAYRAPDFGGTPFGQLCTVVADYSTGVNLEAKNAYGVTAKTTWGKLKQSKKYYPNGNRKDWISFMASQKCVITITYPASYTGLCFGCGGEVVVPNGGGYDSFHDADQWELDQRFFKASSTKLPYTKTSYFTKGKSNFHFMRIK